MAAFCAVSAAGTACGVSTFSGGAATAPTGTAACCAGAVRRGAATGPGSFTLVSMAQSPPLGLSSDLDPSEAGPKDRPFPDAPGFLPPPQQRRRAPVGLRNCLARCLHETLAGNRLPIPGP